MQRDYQWYIENFSLRRLREYLDLLKEKGIVVPSNRNRSNLAQFYFKLERMNEQFLLLERNGWAHRPEALAHQAAIQELVKQWTELEEKIPIEARTIALVNDLNGLVDEYKKFTDNLPIFDELDVMLIKRDFIHLVLKILNNTANIDEISVIIKHADEALKHDFMRNPNRYRWAKKYCDRIYVPIERWWWYMYMDEVFGEESSKNL